MLASQTYSEAVARHDAPARRVQTCLVVDDDPFDRRMLKRCMAKDRPDLSLLECETISEARKLLESVRPDLILLDHRMPDGTGVEFAQELRENAALRDVMICLVTNSDLASIAPTVPAVTKTDLTSRTIWDMVMEFTDICAATNSKDASKAVAQFGEAVQKRFAPPVARMILSVRSARSKFGADASMAGLDELDKLEGMLLVMSEMLSEQEMPRRPDA